MGYACTSLTLLTHNSISPKDNLNNQPNSMCINEH